MTLVRADRVEGRHHSVPVDVNADANIQALMELFLAAILEKHGKMAKDVFAEMFTSGEAPAVIVEKKGLLQVSDTGAIEKFCDEAIAANPKSAEDFRAGKVAALNFLKGQVMKLSKGKANTNLIGEILEKKLKA